MPAPQQVYIAYRAYQRILRESQGSPNVETGGILVGRMFTLKGERWLVIVAASGPGVGADRRGHTYAPDVHTRQRELERSRQEYAEFQVDYIGEWHKHPPGFTQPSEGDTWQVVNMLNDTSYYLPDGIFTPLVTIEQGVFMLHGYYYPRETMLPQPVLCQSLPEQDDVRDLMRQLVLHEQQNVALQRSNEENTQQSSRWGVAPENESAYSTSGQFIVDAEVIEPGQFDPNITIIDSQGYVPPLEPLSSFESSWTQPIPNHKSPMTSPFPPSPFLSPQLSSSSPRETAQQSSPSSFHSPSLRETVQQSSPSPESVYQQTPLPPEEQYQHLPPTSEGGHQQSLSAPSSFPEAVFPPPPPFPKPPHPDEVPPGPPLPSRLDRELIELQQYCAIQKAHVTSEKHPDGAVWYLVKLSRPIDIHAYHVQPPEQHQTPEGVVEFEPIAAEQSFVVEQVKIDPGNIFPDQHPYLSIVLNNQQELDIRVERLFPRGWQKQFRLRDVLKALIEKLRQLQKQRDFEHFSEMIEYQGRLVVHHIEIAFRSVADLLAEINRNYPLDIQSKNQEI